MRHRLPQLVQQHLTARNWTLEDLRRAMHEAGAPWRDDPYRYRVGTSMGTIHALSTDDQAIPHLLTLVALAGALGLSLREVLAACGFAVGERGGDDQQGRVGALLSTVPAVELELYERLATASDDERRAVAAFLDSLQARQGA